MISNGLSFLAHLSNELLNRVELVRCAFQHFSIRLLSLSEFVEELRLALADLRLDFFEDRLPWQVFADIRSYVVDFLSIEPVVQRLDEFVVKQFD